MFNFVISKYQSILSEKCVKLHCLDFSFEPTSYRRLKYVKPNDQNSKLQEDEKPLTICFYLCSCSTGNTASKKTRLLEYASTYSRCQYVWVSQNLV